MWYTKNYYVSQAFFSISYRKKYRSNFFKDRQNITKNIAVQNKRVLSIFSYLNVKYKILISLFDKKMRAVYLPKYMRRSSLLWINVLSSFITPGHNSDSLSTMYMFDSVDVLRKKYKSNIETKIYSKQSFRIFLKFRIRNINILPVIWWIRDNSWC